MPRLRRLVAGLPPQRPSFHARSVHVGLEQAHLRVFRFPSVILQIRRHLRTTTTRRTNGGNLENFQQRCALLEIRKHCTIFVVSFRRFGQPSSRSSSPRINKIHSISSVFPMANQISVAIFCYS
jgi:hypothetical protein